MGTLVAAAAPSIKLSVMDGKKRSPQHAALVKPDKVIVFPVRVSKADPENENRSSTPPGFVKTSPCAVDAIVADAPPKPIVIPPKLPGIPLLKWPP